MHIALERKESLGNKKNKLLKNFAVDPFLSTTLPNFDNICFFNHYSELKLLDTFFPQCHNVPRNNQKHFKFQSPHLEICQNLLCIRSIITELYVYKRFYEGVSYNIQN